MESLRKQQKERAQRNKTLKLKDLCKKAQNDHNDKKEEPEPISEALVEECNPECERCLELKNGISTPFSQEHRDCVWVNFSFERYDNSKVGKLDEVKTSRLIKNLNKSGKHWSDMYDESYYKINELYQETEGYSHLKLDHYKTVCRDLFNKRFEQLRPVALIEVPDNIDWFRRTIEDFGFALDLAMDEYLDINNFEDPDSALIPKIHSKAYSICCRGTSGVDVINGHLTLICLKYRMFRDCVLKTNKFRWTFSYFKNLSFLDYVSHPFKAMRFHLNKALTQCGMHVKNVLEDENMTTGLS